MSEIRVAICGKNEISIEVVRFLLETNDVSIKVFTVFQDDKFNSIFGDLPKFCKDNGVPFDAIRSGNVEESRALFSQIDEFSPDLILSVQFSLIFKRDFIKKYEGRIVNVHFGPLPEFRGVAPISHAIRQGKETFGVTAHIIDQGIDTGPILEISRFNIEKLTNISTYQKSIECGVGIIRDSWAGWCQNYSANQNLSDIGKEQPWEGAFYYSKTDFDYSDVVIPNKVTAYQVSNFVKSLYFPPISWACIELNGEKRKVNSVDICDESSVGETIGKVIRMDENRIYVSTLDRWVVLNLVET